MSRFLGADHESIIKIHDQLAHLSKVVPPIFCSPLMLTREQLSTLIENAFWASLRANEGRMTRVCIVVAAPNSLRDAIAFSTPALYDESHIAMLAPAASPNGCLLVSPGTDGLAIWGLGRGRTAPWSDAVIVEATDPGTVRVGLGPFKTFAVFSGRSISMVEGTGIDLFVYLERALRKLSPQDDFIETQAVARESSALASLAVAIVADDHGGTVLVVPSEEGEWLKSLSSFSFQFAVPDTTIRDLIRTELKSQVAWGEALQRMMATDLPDEVKNLVAGTVGVCAVDIKGAVRTIASLAAVDGAIVVTRDLRVLGFGAKIAVVSGPPPSVSVFQPEPGPQPVARCALEDLGGTRHQSAARFVAANRDAVAIVISQDRHMSVAAWDARIDSVAVVRNAEWLA
jgi:hypothetical protein